MYRLSESVYLFYEIAVGICEMANTHADCMKMENLLVFLNTLYSLNVKTLK